MSTTKNEIKLTESCQVCMIKSVQEKMEEVLLIFPNLIKKEELEVATNLLSILKSKSDEMIILLQIILKVKNDLSYAKLDLERSIITGEEEQTARCQQKVEWLKSRLTYLSSSSDMLFSKTREEFSTKTVKLSNHSISTFVHTPATSTSSNVGKLKNCCCTSKSSLNEEHFLNKVKKDIKVALKHGCNKAGLNSQRINTYSIKKEKTKQKLQKVDLNYNQPSRRMKIERHSHEQYNYEKTFNHTPSASCSQSSEKEDDNKELPCIEEPKGNSFSDYSEVALNRLVGKLEHMYVTIEDASLATVVKQNHEDLQKSLATSKHSIDILPMINNKQSSIVNNNIVNSKKNKAVVKSSSNHYLENANSLLRTDNLRSKSVFPRSPTVWCEELLPTNDLFVAQVQQQQKSKTSKGTSSLTARKKSVKPKSPAEKKSRIKRAAVRVRAVAKLKRQFCIPKEPDDDHILIKTNRIQDLLGIYGLCSDNKNIAFDAAKSLGQLNYHNNEMVIEGLKTAINKNKESLVAYESAKSLLLLGCWCDEALYVVNCFLKNGNIHIQKDLLSTIRISPNSAFVSKQSTELLILSSTLDGLTKTSDSDLAFNAAICVGHLCIRNVNAQQLLLSSLKGSTYAVVADALMALIKQMNCKNDDIIEALLHQVSHASAWKFRMQALSLLKFIGLKRLKIYGIDKVYNVLQQQLWNHPNKSFRRETALLLTEFNLHEEACANTLKQLLDKDESNRAAAVIALSTLKMKGDKELKLLLDMLDLDSSTYVRTQVIRTFKDLNWNSNHVIRALQERQKGDDILANEATIALKTILL